MKISEEEVRHVAKLARLESDETRIHEMSATLSAILTYMEKLDEVDTEHIPPTSYMLKPDAAFRKDEVRESLSLEEALQNAPDRTGAYYRVPRIIED